MRVTDEVEQVFQGQQAFGRCGCRRCQFGGEFSYLVDSAIRCRPRTRWIACSWVAKARGLQIGAAKFGVDEMPLRGFPVSGAAPRIRPCGARRHIRLGQRVGIGGEDRIHLGTDGRRKFGARDSRNDLVAFVAPGQCRGRGEYQGV